MGSVTQCGLFIAVVERGDGYVGFRATRDPGRFLAALSAQATIERTEVRPALAAESIVPQLCGACDFIPGEYWGPIDFERAVAELDDFDLITGYRAAFQGVARGDRVYVKAFGKGVARHFTSRGRVVVRLDEVKGALQFIEAQRSWIKPLVSAAQ